MVRDVEYESSSFVRFANGVGVANRLLGHTPPQTEIVSNTL